MSGWGFGGTIAPEIIDALNAAWDAEIAPCVRPLPRQLTSAEEPHRRVDGRIVNPVLASGLPADDFPRSAEAFRHLLTEGTALAPARDQLGAIALLQITWVESTEGTAWHRDVHPIAPGAPLVGVWVPLEDIAPEAGPFRILSGSQHDFPLADWDEAARAAWRAQFVDRTDPRGVAGARLAAQVDAEIAAGRLVPTEVLPRAGELFWWDGAAVHGSRAPAAGTRRTRRSVLLHLIEARFAT